MRKAFKRKTAEEEALEGIARIRRNGFDPGDELVAKAVRQCGPVQAFVLIRLAALADRDIFSEVH